MSANTKQPSILDRPVIPFRNNEVADQWKKHNCELCAKYNVDLLPTFKKRFFKCELSYYLHYRYILKTIPIGIATQIGVEVGPDPDGCVKLFDKCNEFEAGGGKQLSIDDLPWK